MQANPRLQLVVLDWDGTVLDFGAFAAVEALVEVFARQDVELTIAEARLPAGLGGEDRIEALLRQPSVAEKWKSARGSAWTDSDRRRMAMEFLEPFRDAIRRRSEPVPGAVEVFKRLRSAGVTMALCCGEDHETAEFVAGQAAKNGCQPDVVVSAESGPAGRPAPWMIYEAMRRTGVYPVGHVLKIGDTVPDIDEALHARCWAVGLTEPSSYLGMEPGEWSVLPEAERETRRESVRDSFLEAAAHGVIDRLEEVFELIDALNEQLATGDAP